MAPGVATTMRSAEFWFWWIRDERTGQRMRTRWRMTEERARQYDPRARRLAGSCQIRKLDDDVDASADAGATQGRGQEPLLG